ncbi:GtrA family protein [Myxococcota bacterium]
MRSTRIRSLAVSLASTALDFGLFALCTFLVAGFTALAAARWITGALGAGCNFALNRAWAFRSTDTNVFGQAWRYALAAASAVSMATILWVLIHSSTGWDPRLVHLVSMALVWLGFTYPLLRGWVFAKT